MILSFADSETEDIHNGVNSRKARHRLPNIPNVFQELGFRQRQSPGVDRSQKGVVLMQYNPLLRSLNRGSFRAAQIQLLKHVRYNLWEKAQMKLDMLNRATRLEDLRAPPNNRLEKLSGDLAGMHSIRINDQYRIVFKWDQNKLGASVVRIIDYH